MQIGLTGGIGCGKSTVAKRFAERGFQTLDCDRIVHDLLAEDADTIAAVERLFGPEVLKPGGGVDRAALGERVFSDKALLGELESLLHPRVRERWSKAASQGGDWVIEIPLLFEKNLQKNVDITICVFSDLETQVERLEKRGLNRSQALARMNRQMPLSEKAELADFVILNDGSLTALDEQLDCLIPRIKKLH
ncbi:dephospho-CoA kinase [Pelagicoccus sp. SDUM812003]|uniref:dephospho-CoA kinase n=1 Tax=Pelagicoccus sp. SDUM812003 TaxID=3041267 RepID=UPI00280FDC04|nr:dephospho-CoA kinase [Pelagicoccus sp. SDUM812003]MDQ8204750.1 dephospho-CoA kinase [Pelagicoccus sp. SDUM812003]